MLRDVFIPMKLMVVIPLCTPVLCALEAIFRNSFIVERVCIQILSVTLFVLLSCFSHVQLFVTPWTVAHQAPLSMGFPRQEYWIGMLICFWRLHPPYARILGVLRYL